MRKIYIIKSQNDLYKIGIAEDVSQRISQLQCGNPINLEVIYIYETLNAKRLETNIHNFLKLKNIKREWFYLSGSELENLINRIESNGFKETENRHMSLGKLGVNTKAGIEYPSWILEKTLEKQAMQGAEQEQK